MNVGKKSYSKKSHGEKCHRKSQGKSHKKRIMLFLTLRKLAHAINTDFLTLKSANFQLKILDIFLIFAQKIDCGYTLEPPRRGGCDEYPLSMFWSKNKKNRFTPTYPSFSI